MNCLEYIDSHTGGEPTRLILDGLPELSTNDPAEAKALLKNEHDWIRGAAILEPRGSDVLVGAILLAEQRAGANAAIIFFNNAGYLDMCGHGTIGVVTSLAHLDLVAPGLVIIDTPPGRIRTTLHEDESVSLHNVPSYRYLKDASVDVAGYGRVHGDVAYGGNWFFLVHDYSGKIDRESIDALTAFTVAVRKALGAAGITGKDGAEVDHIEVFGPSTVADSKNFVLCPGLAYDRSPCGTGTSAKLACLYEDGVLKEGDPWHQESVIGSIFSGTVEVRAGLVIPVIRGRAWVTAHGRMLLYDTDPFRYGIRS